MCDELLELEPCDELPELEPCDELPELEPCDELLELEVWQDAAETLPEPRDAPPIELDMILTPKKKIRC